MSKDNGAGIGLFRVAFIGHGTKTYHTLVVPDFYVKINGERHRAHLPELVMGSSLLGLIGAGIMHFAR